jgi:hypothetical protein
LYSGGLPGPIKAKKLKRKRIQEKILDNRNSDEPAVSRKKIILGVLNNF